MRVTIIGAGIMGLSCAWELTRLGHQVTVIEQATIPNPLGSSGDEHRVIRYAYGAELGYQRMVAEAYAAWERLWADLGERLIVDTGTLALDDEDGDWASRSAEGLEAEGHAVTWLDQATLVRRFPLINAVGVERACHLPTGSVLFAERITAALARYLAARGTVLGLGIAAQSVDPEAGRVVLADGSAIDADGVVIATGPWIDRLVPCFRGRVTPSRQLVVYLDPPAAIAEQWRCMPMLLDIGLASGFYAVPPVGGTGLKVGDHKFTLSGDPDQDRVATQDEVASILADCRRRLAGFDDYRVARVKTCFYMVQPEERFLIEPIGRRGWAMSPCSGHGFKFGALLGSTVAHAVVGDVRPDLANWAAGVAA
ncbi:MAG TPA: FAD-dependent oxidoreductase [Stellaceae bacterium]|nr:FAD-dependent oxidoreductase [Stellaceae bacterium]